MKKIVFITSAFFGSTLPLAKRLAIAGFQVDYYIVLGKGGMVDVSEGVDFCPYKAKRLIGKIADDHSTMLSDYFGTDKMQLYYYKRPRPFNSIPFFRTLVAFYLNLFDNFFCKYINSKHYDSANLIGRYDSDELSNFLRYIECPTVVSLHEVAPRVIHDNELKVSRVLSQVVRLSKNIVVHSQNAYDILKMYKGINVHMVHLIHFGLFETYKYVKHDIIIKEQLPEKYILYFGNIYPYKGLDLLYKAVANHREFFKGYKIVVAGHGYVECLDYMKRDDLFLCINRRITNGELSTLIANTDFVVCPYREISQSGIPQTAFVFNKPIVASNLNAFEEVMKNGQNCIFFESGNYNDLAEKMRIMMQSAEKMKNDIQNFEELNKEYSWHHIVQQYVDLFASLT